MTVAIIAPSLEACEKILSAFHGKMVRRILQFLLGLSLSATAATGSTVFFGDQKQQLPPGKAPGTFAFSHAVKVRFTQEPMYPVTVELTDYASHPISRITVTDANNCTLSADLPSGSYWIKTMLAPATDKIYWRALNRFFIDDNGTLNIQDKGEIDLVQSKKMTLLSPPLFAIVTESRPLLKWQPLPGASKYRVIWLIEDTPHHIASQSSGETTSSEFRLTEDLVPTRRYEWIVQAESSSNTPFPPLGYWSAYFYSPGGKEAFAKMPESPSKLIHGAPYLGIEPISLARPGADGILVASVGTDTPALKAGLRPNDILTGLDGKSLAHVSVAEFAPRVHALSPGASVPVEFVRNGATQTVPVTIGTMP